MASVNKAIIIGNLGADPETRYMASGDAVTNLRIATTEGFKDKQGQRQEHTEWHRVSLFGKTAEIAAEYLKKGSAVYIEGRIRTRKWQDKEGADRYSTEIIGDRMQLLSGAERSTERREPQRQRELDETAPAPRRGTFDDLDQDIPFADPYAGRVMHHVV